MIIIEGTDLLGKTTLAKKLCENGLNYQHFTRLSDDFHRFYDYLPFIKVNNVLDRFHMSEPAYIKARGDKLTTNTVWYSTLDRHILNACGFTVLMTAEPDLIRSRWGREEMYDLDTVLKANDAFLEIAESFEIFDMPVHYDLHFHLTIEKPWVSFEECEFILNCHQLLVNRQAYIKATSTFPEPAGDRPTQP